MERRTALCGLFIFAALLIQVPRAAAFDWDPVTDAEKSMKSNPLDPGAGAVVLFKRGQIEVIEKSSLFWTTRVQTYVRIKVFNDAGRDAGNVSVDAAKFVRISKIEGRTILPSGEIIPLDPSKVFRGTAYTEGKNFAILESSFTFPVRAAGSDHRVSGRGKRGLVLSYPLDFRYARARDAAILAQSDDWPPAFHGAISSRNHDQQNFDFTQRNSERYRNSISPSRICGRS